MQFDVLIYDKFRVKHVVNHLIAQTLKAISQVTLHLLQGLPPASRHLAW